MFFLFSFVFLDYSTISQTIWIGSPSLSFIYLNITVFVFIFKYNIEHLQVILHMTFDILCQNTSVLPYNFSTATLFNLFRKHFNFTWLPFTSTIPDILCYCPFISGFLLVPFIFLFRGKCMLHLVKNVKPCLNMSSISHNKSFFRGIQRYVLLQGFPSHILFFIFIFSSSAKAFTMLGLLLIFTFSFCTNP